MAFAALLSALALLSAGPAHLQLAQADSAPPAQAPVATTPDTKDAQADADAVFNGEDPFPTGAPTDDYGFMGWCYGALAGHLALYEKVLPQVRRIEGEFPDPGTSLDKVMQGYRVQHERGERILARYNRALDVEEATGKTGGAERAAVVARGREAWKGADQADPRQLAQLWMSWALPDRCEATARRLAPGVR